MPAFDQCQLILSMVVQFRHLTRPVTCRVPQAVANHLLADAAPAPLAAGGAVGGSAPGDEAAELSALLDRFGLIDA